MPRGTDRRLVSGAPGRASGMACRSRAPPSLFFCEPCRRACLYCGGVALPWSPGHGAAPGLPSAGSMRAVCGIGSGLRSTGLRGAVFLPHLRRCQSSVRDGGPAGCAARAPGQVSPLGMPRHHRPSLASPFHHKQGQGELCGSVWSPQPKVAPFPLSCPLRLPCVPAYRFLAGRMCTASAADHADHPSAWPHERPCGQPHGRDSGRRPTPNRCAPACPRQNRVVSGRRARTDMLRVPSVATAPQGEDLCARPNTLLHRPKAPVRRERVELGGTIERVWPRTQARAAARAKGVLHARGLASSSHRRTTWMPNSVDCMR